MEGGIAVVRWRGTDLSGLGKVGGDEMGLERAVAKLVQKKP